jgi:DNA-directed RNA polymerase specialized sigma24 family protein
MADLLPSPFPLRIRFAEFLLFTYAGETPGFRQGCKVFLAVAKKHVLGRIQGEGLGLTGQQLPNFDEITARLTAYALKLFASHGLYGVDVSVPGLGLSVEDFVGKIVGEYAAGKLKYHASKGTLMGFLGTSLMHDILDAFDKSSHKSEESRVMTRERGNTSEEQKARGPKPLGEFPDEQAVDPDTLLDEDFYRKRLREACEDEPELKELAEAVLDLELYTPKEMSEVLGVPINEVHNRRRKLGRRLIEYKLVRVKQ